MNEKTTSGEFENFINITGKILSVPKEEILRRESEYQKQAASNANRRGPKPKKKPSSLAPADGPPA